MESLLLCRRFAPLFWCQFFSAFGDNFLKNALVMTILFDIGGSRGGALITIAGALFIAPYFLLSGYGGELADRFDKALVARWLKLAEVGIAMLAVVGFWLHSIPALFGALLGFGVIGALFGPLKYGILPDLLDRSRLPMANALVEGATFLAILFGTIVGGLAARNGGDPWSFAGLMVVLAALSLVSSLFIPTVGSGAPELKISANVFASTWALLADLKREPRLWWCALASSWFWSVGAVVLSLLPPLVKDTLGGTEDTVTVFLAVFSIAVAVGSGLAAWLCAGRVILLPAVIGAILLGILSCDVAWTIWGAAPAAAQSVGAVFSSTIGLHLATDLGGMAIAFGLFIVPVFAALQSWADPERRGRVIAGVNVLNAAFIVVGAGMVAGLQAAGLELPSLFALIGVATLVAAYAIATTMPANGLMDFLSMLFRAFYRLEVHGAEHFEAAGPNAIIALNHVSFLDAALALSILPREPVFAIDSDMAKKWWVKPFLRFTKAMPLDPRSPMGTRTLIHAVKAGSPLVIFPEGRLTVTGSLMKVYDGAGLIADKTGAKVVSVRLEGLQYTQFTRLRGTQVRKRWFPKIVVTALPPVTLTVDEKLKGKHRRQAAGAALYEIMSNLVYRTTSIERTIPESLIEAAEVHGMGRIAVEDPISGALSYRKLLVGIRVLGEKLMVYAEQGKTIGVMLPNANATAVVITGLMSAGRVPAMINFTAGATNIRAACRAAEIGTIVTSKAFVEKGRLDPLLDALRDSVRIVFLEDIRATVGLLDKIKGWVNHRAPIVKSKAGDWAAVLFTSGSEGTPKGVVLTHRNILANAAQAAARIDFGREDKLFSVLPVFHSFGLTVGTVLPLVSGVPVFFYPSPLHYRIVPELVYGTNATILLGTDTFLNGYARAAHAYDFRSLRYILAGAEPVKEQTRQVYMEKFGIRILEGYGVTETGPALALNTPMFTRYGTVGRLLPGVSYRLEKVEGIEDGGRLWVSGPNIMAGYLRAEEPGVLHPPEQGWHDTGDIVTVDEQGFVKIQGRAKRFAKIAGEMVSLAAVEALAAALWPDAQSAAVALPDPRKGERIVMVTEKSGATRAAFQASARSKGATELMVPTDFVHVEKLPLLGSGKIDNVAIGKVALERTSPSPEVVEAVE
jgi:acyl-[acyl-carrier-protein]-phospholipid O-acyltransferase/long-chain-fatty-acid--[acyl-carrier-protein] ligase